MTHDAFMHAARDHIAACVDAQIMHETDLHVRLAMMRARDVIIGKMLDLTAIQDLKRRLAEAEERHLRLVS